MQQLQTLMYSSWPFGEVQKEQVVGRSHGLHVCLPEWTGCLCQQGARINLLGDRSRRECSRVAEETGGGLTQTQRALDRGPAGLQALSGETDQ